MQAAKEVGMKRIALMITALLFLLTGMVYRLSMEGLVASYRFNGDANGSRSNNHEDI
jgi:K+-transporting ATPase c subunit